jgi:serine protease Do
VVAVRNLSLIAACLASSGTLALEPDQVFEKVSPSVVVVAGQTINEGEIAFGSGVVVAPGEIVTNCHVIEDAVSPNRGRTSATS